MSYISLERRKNELSVNCKIFGPTGVYPSKTQPDICAKAFVSHVTSSNSFSGISFRILTGQVVKWHF